MVNRTVIAKLDNMAVAKLIESLHTGMKFLLMGNVVIIGNY